MKTKILIVTSFLLIMPSFASAQFVYPYGGATSTTSEWSYDRSLAPLVVPADLSEVLNAKQEKIEEKKEFNSANLYQAIGSKLRKSNTFHGDPKRPDQKIWDIFISIAGEGNAQKYVQKFLTFNGPHDPVLGFVQIQTLDNPGWAFAINSSGLSLSDKKWVRDNIVTVMIHEYAHLLTLSTKQVNYIYNAKHSCAKTPREKDQYAVDFRECSKKDSYINNFVAKFWTNDQIEKSNGDYFPLTASQFYNLHRSEFVTPYSVTSPVEDIAESFTDFVLQRKPLGLTKKEQKILFFYNYPELVQIRSSIRDNVKQYFIN